MVKVLALRRRQCENANAARSKSNAQPKLDTKGPPSANHISSESVSQLSSSYMSSYKSSLRSSSQVSTLHPSQSEEEIADGASTGNRVDIEMGSKKSKDKSGAVQSQSQSSRHSPTSSSSPSMDTEQSETAPPSVVSWPKNLPIPFEVKTNRKSVENTSRRKKSSQRSQRQSLSNAMVDQASELTHSSATTNSTVSGGFRPSEANNNHWGLPSDPRALPVYLMPLAVLPLICLVVLIMAGILIGIVIESYF